MKEPSETFELDCLISDIRTSNRRLTFGAFPESVPEERIRGASEHLCRALDELQAAVKESK